MRLLFLKIIFFFSLVSCSNIDFFLGTTTNVKAGKIMEAFKAKPIPVESLTYSSFIIFPCFLVLFIIERMAMIIPVRTLPVVPNNEIIAQFKPSVAAAS